MHYPKYSDVKDTTYTLKQTHTHKLKAYAKTYEVQYDKPGALFVNDERGNDN